MTAGKTTYEKSKRILENLPDYIGDFFVSKSASGLSSLTLYEYLKEYKRFFTWLIDFQGLMITPKDLPSEVLENLPQKDIETYISSLRGLEMSTATINRTIASLRSLYRYLTEQFENKNLEPLFYRNVMKKIPLQDCSETLTARANNLKDKLYTDGLTGEFLDFLSESYADSLPTERDRRRFIQHKERDIALIALLLASGLRVGECRNLKLDDLNIREKTCTVNRKGSKKDVVHFAYFAVPYLENYLSIREKRYQATDEDRYLFVTRFAEKVNPISVSTIEKKIAKYTKAFGVPTTPHKFRHTLASSLYKATKDQVLVATQLGHSDTRTTDLYTHVNNNEQREALDSL